MCIRSNLSFVLNHGRDYLKNYGVFLFIDIQCYVILFGENGVFLDLYPWIQGLTHKKTPWHVKYCWIPNFKYIMNIKLSFAKNEME